MPNNPDAQDLCHYTPPEGEILRCRVLDAGMQTVGVRTFDTGAKALAWMQSHAEKLGGTLHWVLSVAGSDRPVWRYNNGVAPVERLYRVTMVPASTRATNHPSVPATLPCPGNEDSDCTGTADCRCEGRGFVWAEDFQDNDDVPSMPTLLPEVQNAD